MEFVTVYNGYILTTSLLNKNNNLLVYQYFYKHLEHYTLKKLVYSYF